MNQHDQQCDQLRAELRAALRPKFPRIGDQEFDELFHDAFSEAWRLGGQERLNEAFLCVSISNESRRRHQRSRLASPEQQAPQALEPTGGLGPGQQAALRELQERVQSYLASLPNEARTLFVLRAVYDLAWDAVARVLGTTVDAVKSQRTRVQLRAKQHATAATLIAEFDELRAMPHWGSESGHATWTAAGREQTDLGSIAVDSLRYHPTGVLAGSARLNVPASINALAPCWAIAHLSTGGAALVSQPFRVACQRQGSRCLVTFDAPLPAHDQREFEVPGDRLELFLFEGDWLGLAAGNEPGADVADSG